MPLPALIELENVSIKRGPKLALAGVSLRIEEGENVAILGPNGCGKSTFIRALTRELYPYAGAGHVRILGREQWLISELRTVLGVVSEEPRGELLGEPTGMDMVVSGLVGTYGVLLYHSVTSAMRTRAWLALKCVEGERLAHQPVETMSTGERRRIFIARALVCEPKALVLDEPTSGLDMQAAFEFHKIMRGLARSGTSLILVTHHLEELVPEIERVVMLKDGKVVADGPRGEVLTAEKVAGLFGISDPALLAKLSL